jgi:hypothetical protein
MGGERQVVAGTGSLRCRVEPFDPVILWVLDQLAEWLGVQRLDAVPGDGLPHLHYGPGQPAPGAAVVVRPAPGDLLWPAAIEGALEPASLPLELPFDLLAAMAAFLTDRPHATIPAGARDEHGRLTFAASVPARNGFGDRAIVDRYVLLFAALAVARLGVVARPLWPGGRRAAIGLSHDVDHPDRYPHARLLRRPWRLLRAPRTLLRAALEDDRRARQDPRREAWPFDALRASEARRGFRSTYFFAATSRLARNGSLLDVPYDIRESRFVDLVRALRDDGVEVGLHASYRAHAVPGMLAAEKDRLERVAGTQVHGLRHHYWQLGPDPAATLGAHAEAGFRYDSSLAFNDHPGFRRSVARGFNPFDTARGRALGTRQLPVFCMDGSVLYGSEDVDAAVASVAAALAEVRAVGGLGVIDWHAETSIPDGARPAWGTAYQEVLDLAAADPGLWVTDLGSIDRWLSERAVASVPIS